MNAGLLLFATALAAAPGIAQPPKGRGRAPVRSAAHAPAPAPRTFTMKNGMKVTLLHVGRARKAVVALVLETGEIDEPAFGPGLAALTAQMLLQGTVARSAQQIQSESAALGTKLDVRAGPVTTTLSGELESVRIPRFLSLVADLVRHPLLDSAGFGRVRRAAMRTLDSTLRSPAALARRQWRAIIFPDGPFGHPYSFASTLGALQLGHVRNVYDDNYSASRAHLYVSGSFNAAVVEESARQIFGDWPAGMAEKPVEIHAATVHELVTLDLPGAERSVTWIGLPTIGPGNADFAKLEVADMLVAGGDSSRAAIDVGSIEGAPPHGNSTFWQRRGASYWVDVLDVRTANTAAAVGALVGELRLLKATVPSRAEVARARERVIAAFEARNNSPDGLLSLVALMDEHGLGDAWRTGYVRRVMAVTPEDVRSAIAEYLDPDHMAIAIAGDRAAIEPQLAKLRPAVP